MTCVCPDVIYFVPLLKCKACGAKGSLVIEKPGCHNPNGPDRFWVDSDGNYVLPLRAECLECRKWYTVAFTFDSRTMKVISID
jgi:hypothetical protein